MQLGNDEMQSIGFLIDGNKSVLFAVDQFCLEEV